MLAYEDCQKAFDRAVTSEKGVKLKFESNTARDRFMFRCFFFRQLDRKNNIIIYPEPAHSMHGRSIYDTVSLIRRTDGELEMRKISVNFEIEDLI